MAVVVISDNYYYMQGLNNIADEFCYVSCLTSFTRQELFKYCLTLRDEDDVIINISSLDKMVEMYTFYAEHSQANVILATEAKLVNATIAINNILFLSSDASVLIVERFIKSPHRITRKRVLTFVEENVMSLIMMCQAMNEVSCYLGMNIKTISLHKNRIKHKLGLVCNNNVALFSMMRFIINEGNNPKNFVGYF